MTTPQDAISTARKEGRSALDESTGKQLLEGFGITVPQSIVTKDAGTAVMEMRVR